MGYLPEKMGLAVEHIDVLGLLEFDDWQVDNFYCLVNVDFADHSASVIQILTALSVRLLIRISRLAEQG